MVRIRYIGEQLIARAFDHTFHRKHWDEDHGLESGQIAILTSNPQFEVGGFAPLREPSDSVLGAEK